jgi:hypothetical protein
MRAVLMKVVQAAHVRASLRVTPGMDPDRGLGKVVRRVAMRVKVPQGGELGLERALKRQTFEQAVVWR